MAGIVIEAEKRERTGSAEAGRMRRRGLVPAIVFGRGREAVSIAVSARELRDLLRTASGVNALVDLRIPEVTRDAKLAAIVREVQHDPLMGQPIHVDFQWISLTENVTVRVPVRMVGEAPGVVLGGVLDQVLHEVEVECVPTIIPDFLIVDVSGMEMHDARHIADLVTPEGVRLLADPEDTVLTLIPPTTEPVEAEAELAVEEGEAEAEE